MARWDDTEWFRSSTWDEATAAEFERRLAHARPDSRPQYIRIQASHLVSQSDPALRLVGRDLLSRVIEEYEGDDIQAKSAVEQLARSLAEEGRLDEAELMYRQVRDVIARSAIGASGTTGLAGLALAELLIRKGDAASLAEAGELLDTDGPEIEEEGVLLRDRAIRYLIARTRLARGLGDPAAASGYASHALEVAAETTPTMPRHPDLGRPRMSDAERAELLALEEWSHPSAERGARP